MADKPVWLSLTEMKILTVILLSLLNLTCSAGTWTFHGFGDNYLWCYVGSQDLQEDYVLQWDKASDTANPALADSGTFLYKFDGTLVTESIGYADALTIEADASFKWTGCELGGPDYQNLTDSFVALNPAGEYWIDWTPNGDVRISTIQPADFGKWAWDGSINPSWIAAKKGFAKGHNKQPLPSPK